MEGTQYQILDRIDVGGMAEIFRAKNLDTGATVAIKRILPELSRQPEFVDMFVDEAAVCMLLDHPNIVRVYELGMMDGDLFLSMEYIAGLNLRDLLNYANANNYPIPIAEAILIAIHVLDGLEYAHHCRDNDGVPIHLIHRDVSPPNILLGYNGDVKITDFGLVKAKSQMSRTVPGLIKGKFSYLSPEAAYGESIDLRSDIYAVGIILWEMLACRPLYTDPVEVKILDMVRRSIIPELAPINPGVTPELEAIVQKALARNRDDRYPSAKAFADALRVCYKNIGRPKSHLREIVALANPPVRDDDDAPKPISVSQLVPLEEIEASIRREKEKAALARQNAPKTETRLTAEHPDTPASAPQKTDEITRESAPTTKPKNVLAPKRPSSDKGESNAPLFVTIAILFLLLCGLVVYLALN